MALDFSQFGEAVEPQGLDFSSQGEPLDFSGMGEPVSTSTKGKNTLANSLQDNVLLS